MRSGGDSCAMRNSKKTDPRGGHIRFYWQVYDSPAYRALGVTDQRAYWALLRQLNSFNNGDLSLPISVARHHGITNESTLARNLRALCSVGLVAVTRKGSHRRDGSHEPHLYRLTDVPVLPIPGKNIEASGATNEWRNVTSIAMGRALVRETERRWRTVEWPKIVAEREARKAARQGVGN